MLANQGKLAAALEAYRASLAVAEGLAKADNAQRQHDLSVSQAKIGDVLRAQGNLASALESYYASPAILERLAEPLELVGLAVFCHNLAAMSVEELIRRVPEKGRDGLNAIGFLRGNGKPGERVY